MALLMQKLDQWRRAGLTGFAFLLFGSGGVLVAVTIFPMLALIPGTQDAKRRRGQRVIHHSFRFFIGFWKALGLLSYETPDLEALNRPGQLIIANHPSLIDVVFLISFIQETNCVVKQGLYRNPFTRWIVMAAQYISNANSEGLIEDCAANLRANNSLLIFPEGTRTEYGKAMKLQRGAANIALRAEKRMLPVYIDCDQPMLTKQHPWYKAPPQKPHYRFILRSPIELSQPAGQPNSRVTRQLSRQIEQRLSAN